jgi:hypothetical protein
MKATLPHRKERYPLLVFIVILLRLAFASPVTTVHAATINAVFPPLRPTDKDYQAFSNVLASPLVDGISPPLRWSMIDKGPGAPGGQYQWAAFDHEIQHFIDAGKKVNLIVWAIAYGPLGAAVPAYVLNDPKLVTVNCKGKTNWPVVYESAFNTPYKAFIAEVLRHYANNPHIGYIRFGLSIGGEIFPWCGREEAALKGLTIEQWRDQVWLPYDKAMLDYEKSLSPTMQIIAPTTRGGGPGDLTWIDTEAANAVADGFGFGNQGLQKEDISSYPNCVSGWCAPFDRYAGQVPLELQTIALSAPGGACTTSNPEACKRELGTGPLPPLLDFGLKHHATIFEIYTDDLMVALDPNNPAYASYHTEYANALAAAHRK